MGKHKRRILITKPRASFISLKLSSSDKPYPLGHQHRGHATCAASQDPTLAVVLCCRLLDILHSFGRRDPHFQFVWAFAISQPVLLPLWWKKRQLLSRGIPRVESDEESGGTFVELEGIRNSLTYLGKCAGADFESRPNCET